MYGKKLSVADIITGFEKLSKLLYKHFGKKSIILIDEYDAPIVNAIISSDETQTKKIIQLFKDIN
jgi:hypothetical protein